MSTRSWLHTRAYALWQGTKSKKRRGDRRRTSPTGHGDLTVELLEDRRLLSVLGYSTYWGGSRNETAGAIATDSAGNTYVTGTTYSANLPGSSGPDAQIGRAFVTKFTASGQVAYSTILGPTPKWDDTGFAESKGFDLVIGPDDLPIVSFETFETQTVSGFPLPGPRFLHVAKLSDVGVATFDTIAPVLDVADHLAPYSFTAVHLAVDDTGGAYAAYTALRETFGGGVALDPFITKVAPNGAVEFTEALLISVGDLALDDERNIYVATTTSLDDLPVTAGAFQPEKNAVSPDRTDIWIAKLDPTASALLGATYLGGAHNDTIGALAISPNHSGLVYLVGTTESDDFPVQNPLQPRPAPDSGIGDTEFSTDAFVAALDLTVSPEVSTMKLLASTYFGGSRGDFLTDVAIDAAGGVYVVGSTNSADLPLANPLQPVWNDGPIFHELGSAIVAHDLIAAKFDASLTGLEFSTYLGGSGHDYQARLAVDSNGTIHVAAHSAGTVHDINGNAVSTADFPVLNAVQTTFGGGDPGLGSLETDAVVLAIGQRGVVSGIGSRATLGREFNDIVANFNSFRHTASPDDFTATIHWGDGTTSTGTVSRPSSGIPTFLVSGTHVYNTPGAFPVVVEVEDHLAPELSPIRNINVSRNDISQTGGSIAVDPTDPSRLFAAMTDEQGVANAASGSDGGIVAAMSRDGGQTWTPRVIGNAADEVLPRAAGDPDVLFDDFGNLFLTYRGVEGNNIVVAWSTDGGATFEAAALQELVPPGSTGGTGTSAVGSPKLAFGAANHEIWVAFEDLANGLILAAGAGVGGVGDVGSFALKTVTGSNNGASSDIAIGPNGEVAVIWQAVPVGAGTAQLLAGFDLDGLGTGEFAMPATVDTSTTDGELTTPAQQSPVPLGATLAWDTSDGPHRGRLYAAYVDMADDVAGGSPELTLLTTFTDNLGVDWSDPSRVTLDAQFQSMFLPSIALDAETGNVAVGWYGTRGPLGTVVTAADFFVATTTDGQAFSEPQQVNAGAMDAFDPALSPYGMENGFGEATSMAFLNRRLYPVWADNSALGGENYYPSQFEVATSIVGVIDVRVPPVAIRPRAIQAIRGETFDGTVATFTHPDGGLRPGDFTATIHWGDGAESPGTITQPGGPNTEFSVTGSHVFADAGAFPVWIEVHDNVHGLTATPVSSVNAERGSQAEATIAIDPTNPDRVFAAGVHVNFQWPIGIPIATSEDGGVTWTSGTIADGIDGLPPSIGDPKAVFDQYGNLFLTYLTPSPQRDVVVLLSTNGGQDFTLLATFTDVDGADQPSIAVGPGEGGSEGSVWLTWERGEHPFQIIMAAGAPVHGLGAVGGFGQRLVAPLSADGFYRNFGDIAVGPDGQVLLTYIKGGLVKRSGVFNE